MSTVDTPTRPVPIHLRHLRRDPRTGWPAPFVNAWTSELDVTGNGILELGTYRDQPAFVQRTSPGQGVVDFTRQHIGRTRTAMDRRSCQVCQEPRAKLLIVATGISGQTDVIAGRQVALFSEPLICARCATFAIDHCPGLIRRRRSDQLTTIRPVELLDSISTGTHDHFPDVRALMWRKFAVPVQSLPAHARRLLAAWEPS